jgi:NAD(P)-dependent dehydrogenase (short-subunit alcohol dehydrogenase family)
MPDIQSQRLKGKIILVTGASQGIGFYTAQGLAEMGAHAIIVSHNAENCQDAVKIIRQAAGEESARYYIADLSIQREVRELVGKIKRDYDHLDVLVNNVGAWNSTYQETPEGIEKTFALNHLSYFLLTGLLLEQLKASASARIVNIASDAHKGIDRIHFENIGLGEKYRPFKAYAQSKLANIMFTYELAARLEGTGVTANALHPGTVASKFYRQFGILEPLIRFWLRLSGNTSEEGAQTPIYLAGSLNVADVSGKYFDAEQNQTPSSKASYDEEAWKKLWVLCEKLTNFTYLL